jgi:hypothetical protein
MANRPTTAAERRKCSVPESVAFDGGGGGMRPDRARDRPYELGTVGLNVGEKQIFGRVGT